MTNHTHHKTESTEPFTISLKRAEGSISDLCFYLFISCMLLLMSLVLIYELSQRTHSSIKWSYMGFLCWFVVLVSFFFYLMIQSCFVEVMMTEKYLINRNRMTKQIKRIRLDQIITYQIIKYRRREVCFLKVKDIHRQSHRFIYSPEALDPYFLPKMERQRAINMNKEKVK